MDTAWIILIKRPSALVAVQYYNYDGQIVHDDGKVIHIDSASSVDYHSMIKCRKDQIYMQSIYTHHHGATLFKEIKNLKTALMIIGNSVVYDSIIQTIVYVDTFEKVPYELWNDDQKNDYIHYKLTQD